MKKGSLEIRLPFQLCLNFAFVARPPLICLSLLFFSSTPLTFSQSSRSIPPRRRVTSVWTVDLLTLYIAAHCLTVAPVSAIYFPRVMARLWLSVFISFPPQENICRIYYKYELFVNLHKIGFLNFTLKPDIIFYFLLIYFDG